MSNVLTEDSHHHYQHHHHHHHHRQSPQHLPQQQQQQQQQQPQQTQQQQNLSPTKSSLSQNNDINPESPRPVGDALEQHCRIVEEELQTLRESDAKFRQQYADVQRRERLLVRRLAAKEQELQDYANQNAELKATQAPTPSTLKCVLLDPAVNILFQKLKAELQSTKARLEDTQNELSAWKFTPDSNTGKRLMAKCRLLYQENEELGKMTSNGRLAKLEGDLALQKSFSEEVKKSQSELDDFLQELDEDVEGMQSTILFLQQELKLAKDTISTLERENYILRNGGNCDLQYVEQQQQQQQQNELKENDNMDTSDCLINGSQSINNQCTTNMDLITSPTSVTLGRMCEKTSLSILNNCNNSNLMHNNCGSERLIKKESVSCSNINTSITIETRTLRSSGSRGINSVTMDDMRGNKFKGHTINNGDGIVGDSNGDREYESEIDHSNGNNADLPINFTSSSHHLLRKAYKRSYKEELPVNDSNDIEDDNDNADNDFNINSNNNNSNNCKDGTRGIYKISSNKKTRRTSVLSLDLNEDDSQIGTDDECSTSLSSHGTSKCIVAASIASPDPTSISTANGAI